MANISLTHAAHAVYPCDQQDGVLTSRSVPSPPGRRLERAAPPRTPARPRRPRRCRGSRAGRAGRERYRPDRGGAPGTQGGQVLQEQGLQQRQPRRGPHGNLRQVGILQGRVPDGPQRARLERQGVEHVL